MYAWHMRRASAKGCQSKFSLGSKHALPHHNLNLQVTGCSSILLMASCIYNAAAAEQGPFQAPDKLSPYTGPVHQKGLTFVSSMALYSMFLMASSTPKPGSCRASAVPSSKQVPSTPWHPPSSTGL